MKAKMPTKTIRFDYLLCETPKAFLFGISGKKFWLPKALCRSLQITGKHLLNGTTTHGHVTIPEFKYEEISKETYVEAYDEVTIEKHVPTKLKAVESNEVNELMR